MPCGTAGSRSVLLCGPLMEGLGGGLFEALAAFRAARPRTPRRRQSVRQDLVVWAGRNSARVTLVVVSLLWLPSQCSLLMPSFFKDQWSWCSKTQGLCDWMLRADSWVRLWSLGTSFSLGPASSAFASLWLFACLPDDGHPWVPWLLCLPAVCVA